MSDTINSTSFDLAIGKSRQVVLLISESKKGQNIFLHIFDSESNGVSSISVISP